MLAEIILALFLGIIFGTFTGLIPGIHINLVSVILVSLASSTLYFISPVVFVVFIASMAITHTFVDFIPSIFLGCPDTDTELSILPGHEMLKQGLGYEAIILSAYGSLAAVFALILISVPSAFFIDNLHNMLSKKYVMPFLLIFVSGFMVGLEKNIFKSFFVFLLSGVLGYIVLNLSFPSSIFSEPLLPLLTGLFGASSLILSIKNKPEIPKQKISIPKASKSLMRPFFGALAASPLSSFLPGLGSGQAAIIGNLISRPKSKDSGRQGFLFLLGATNTLVMGFSFITLYVISRTRTGAAVAIQNLFGPLTTPVLALILATVLASGIFAFYITKYLGKVSAKNMSKVNYSKLSMYTLCVLAAIVLLVSRPFGFLVFLTATAAGIYCISLGVRRTQMMGCLLLPTIIFYLI